MSKIIDLNDGRDNLDNKKIDKVIHKLHNLNKLPGYKYIEEMLDAVLIEIKQNVLDYYDGQYDEDEPNIASFNTQQLIDELRGVSNGTYTVNRE